ncbi:MAG: hypothetical protein ABW250_00625 [Pyrinomonadaceae bacterium]
MSRLSKWQVDSLPTEIFAIVTPEARLCPLLDASDARNAWARASFTGDPPAVRRRIIDICLKKGIKLTPAMATQAIAEEVAAHSAKQGAGDSTNAAGGNTLRFTVRDEGDLTRACETAREKLKGKGEAITEFQSRHNTAQGQAALQQVHDTVARYGAICKKPANLSAAEFVSKHESTKLQEMHDLAVAGGARCNEQGASPFFSGGAQPVLRDPRERAREHAERRNRQIRGESGAATSQAELSEPTPSTDPQEAAREQARAAARRHIAKRNEQIKQRKKNIEEGREPYFWRQR